jgi:chitodextrinase
MLKNNQKLPYVVAEDVLDSSQHAERITVSTTRQRRNFYNFPIRLLVAASLLFGGAFVFVAGGPLVGAAACTLPSTDLGTDTITMTVPQTATYTVWTRMKAPDTTHNSVSLEVDGNTCLNVGGGSFTATSWLSSSANWINYTGGSPSSVISLNLTAGSHTFKYIGTQSGVEIDRVIVASDASCVPTGTGSTDASGRPCDTGDSTGPTVSLQSPTSGQSLTGSVTMNATASDASGIASVAFLVDGNVINTDTASPYSYAWNSAGVANGTHTVAARATDKANNTTTTTAINVTVSNTVACTATPSVPANLRVSGTTANSVSLAWDASTAASGCTLQGYRVYRNGTQVATPTGTTYADSSLSPSTAYSYTIQAIDTSAHVSAQSGVVSGSTTADTTAPTIPANVHTTLKTSTTIALAWNASTDNGGIKDYIIFRNGTQVGTSTTNTFTATSLAPSTSYSFTVRARDLADNQSAASATLTDTTLAGTGANKGDLDGNGTVNLTDLSVLLSNWSRAGVSVNQGDVNADGKVDLVDLSILLTNWGKSV